MNSFFARASALQVFLTLVGAFVAVMLVFAVVISSSPALIASAIGRLLMLSVLLSFGALALRWVWVVVHVAARAAPERTVAALTIFRWTLAYIALDVVVFSIFFASMSYGESAFLVFMVMHMAAGIASLVFSLCSAHILACGLVGERAHIGHTIGYLFALAYWPIGIWFIQPSIRRM